MNGKVLRRPLTVAFFLLALISQAQDSIPSLSNKYIFFPYPLANKTWRSSLGLTMTSMPQDITEEVQVRAPAGDYHVLRGLPKGFYLDGRINFQVIQNHASLGIRWAHAVNSRVSYSVGDDFGFWYGKIKLSGFDTRATGWFNYPNVSVGYRIDDELLLTLKGEAMFNLSSQSTVGGLTVKDRASKFSGWSAAMIIEQPFFSKKSISLGVRAMYTDFFWQTWSLYQTFDRKIFYPEVIVGFIF